MRKVTTIAAILLSVLMFFRSDISVEDEVVYADDVMVHSVIPEPIFVDVSPIVTIKPLEEFASLLWRNCSPAQTGMLYSSRPVDTVNTASRCSN